MGKDEELKKYGISKVDLMRQENLPPKFDAVAFQWKGDGERYPYIHPSARIHPDCRVSPNAVIGPGCAIGFDGFNYNRDKVTGKATLKKHKGTVVIYEDVEIHSNVCIDRGLYGDTIIKKGVRIDNLVHIAHDVVIGENTLVVAGTVIGGEVTIGKNNFIGINVSIKPQVSIGCYNVIGMGTVVLKDIPHLGVYIGSPAIWLKSNRGWWNK